MKGPFAAKLEHLRGDNVHGATTLTRVAAELFAEALAAGSTPEEMRALAKEAVRSHPTMAPIYRLAVSMLRALERGESGDDVALICLRFVDEMEEASHVSVTKALARYEGYGRVVTISASSLVEAFVAQAVPARVLCCESRPVCEGRELASRLGKRGLAVTLTVDALLPSLLEEGDLLLLGADGIGAFGLVHKAGTWPLVLAARERGVRVAVLASTQKFWPLAHPKPVESPKEPGEVAEGPFEVLNLYFDTTPLDAGYDIVTEAGVWGPREALAYMQTLEPIRL
ncbi:hypothetical protein [Hydrogenimonas sp.]